MRSPSRRSTAARIASKPPSSRQRPAAPRRRPRGSTGGGTCRSSAPLHPGAGGRRGPGSPRPRGATRGCSPAPRAAGEVAFRQVRKAFIEKRGHRAPQEAVAQELEALVVRRAVAAVGERLAREPGLANVWPRRRSSSARPSKARRRAPACGSLGRGGHEVEAGADVRHQGHSHRPVGGDHGLAAFLGDLEVVGRTFFTSSMALRLSKELRMSRTVPLRSPCSSMARASSSR
jgi:hypothetical protein